MRLAPQPLPDLLGALDDVGVGLGGLALRREVFLLAVGFGGGFA